MARLAATFYSLLDLPVSDIVECFRAAEEGGFEFGVMAESAGRDAISMLTNAAVATRDLKLGTNVLPIYSRSPMQVASAALTLDEISGGRFQMLGLGSSYRKRVERWFGTAFATPLRRTREFVEVVRELLSPGTTTYAGEIFTIEDYPPVADLLGGPTRPPIYIGATGPKMCALAGEIADGVLLNSLSTPASIRQCLGFIEQGAVGAGRDPSDLDIACNIIFSASEDRDEALDAAKETLLFYVIYPEMDPIVATTEFMPQVEGLREAYWSGHPDDAYRMLTEPIVDSFAVFGTPEECRAKLDRYKDAGVDLLIIRSCVDKTRGKHAVLRNIDALYAYG